MIINGTITQAGQASPPSGQFQVRYQDIVITDQAGQEWVGRIGSKAGYQVNTPVTVTVEEKQQDGVPYNYFRKHNPQYPNQPAPQTPKPKAAGQTNNGEKEMRIVRGNALNAIMSAAAVAGEDIPMFLNLGVQFILTGTWPTNEPTTTDGIPISDDIPF